MANRHKRLAQGQLFHSQQACQDCAKTVPPIRAYIDDGLEILDNHVSCGGLVWDFSVGLLVRHPRYNGKTPYIVRACSKHANYHLHKWEPLRPFAKNEEVRSIKVLDSLEEADKAYQDSQEQIPILGLKEWWSKWHRI